MSDPVLMADHSNSARHISPEQVLEEALRRLRSGEWKASQLMVIALNNGDGEFDFDWLQAGMRTSEIVALLEVVKASTLALMDVIGRPRT